MRSQSSATSNTIAATPIREIAKILTVPDPPAKLRGTAHRGKAWVLTSKECMLEPAEKERKKKEEEELK